MAAADGLCSYLQRCLPTIFNVGYADLAACKTRGELACAIDTKSPGHATVPVACANDLKTLACSGGTLIAPVSCRVKGTLADNAICENDAQCTSGACVKPPGATSPCGTCQARAAASGSCADNAKCDWDLVCAGEVCRTPAAKDAACVKGQCLGPYRCIGGTCKDPVQLDGACSEIQADDDHCDTTKLLFCQRTNPPSAAGTCKALQFAGPNQPCGIVNNAIVGCGAGTSCEGPLASKTCKPKAADGAACDTGIGPSCNDPAECINGKCTLPRADRCK